jgi:hypothetical protein
MKTQRQFIVTITVDKDIPELVDFVAGRVYTLPHVVDAEALEVVATSPQKKLIDAIISDSKL